MVVLDHFIGAVRLELDPAPLRVVLSEFTQKSMPVADRFVTFVQQVDVDAILVSKVDKFTFVTREDRELVFRDCDSYGL